ncbi:hypothetical protein D6858_12690 [Tsuneonella suprasediminis]|uniref:Glycerophosphoryl diester phosphodiesterase membrane domain-containing protein n=2 Tax=Tsuneonella suprasediminis TaxID=2306996 RepID=A0A419QZI6_9SPHN|nr:hypothetical protein D6858_12690 [Tsuneonella suprasediminis]
MGTGVLMSADRQIGFADILSQTVETLSAGARAAAIYFVVVGALGAAGVFTDLNGAETDVFFGFRSGFIYSADDGIVSALLQFAAWIASVIGGYLLVKTFLFERGAAVDSRNRFWAYIGMSIVSTIGTVLGFLLFIVPGIIIAVRWIASSGFLVGSNEGPIDSLSASWEATRGHSWPIFFAGVLLMIGYAVAIAFFVGIFSATGMDRGAEMIAKFVEPLASVLTTALGVSVYLLVSDRSKEVSDVFT